MAKRIITISREVGSGGRFIGEETAKKLGIGYYDKLSFLYRPEVGHGV